AARPTDRCPERVDEKRSEPRQAEVFVEEDVLVCEDAPPPDADAEPDVWVDVLLDPPCPAPTVVVDPVEVWAFEAPDPLLAEPVVVVWALAEPVPLFAEPVVAVCPLAEPDRLLAEPAVAVCPVAEQDPP